MTSSVAISLILLAILVVAAFLTLRRGMRWGSTAGERSRRMPGDSYLEIGLPARLAMTRAISIRARPGEVWPWLAQLGRGAGWYSVDRLDNGGKVSARHIVSWIPEPRAGDAAPIGYLRHIETGRSLVWWAEGVRFFGARARLVVDIQPEPENSGTRLVIRMSADAAGITAHVALLVFAVIDSVMARRQLLGIRDRVERYDPRREPAENPETGARDQYQLYEVIYASGETAGVPGKENARAWRKKAMEDGVLPGTP